MGLLTKQILLNRVEHELRKSLYDEFKSTITKAHEVINEARSYQRKFDRKEYDIFLSHSSDDSREVAGLKLMLEDYGFSVYVDWIEDPEVDRSQVSKKNAQMLRTRMKQCSALIYAFSKNAMNSKWMPWELGYFDGINGLVSIMPIAEQEFSSFSGNEYLELYPYIDIESIQDSLKKVLWVNESNDTYVEFDL